jgi:hypothetical protein
MNLLKETIAVFNDHNLVPHNILFIGCEETGHRCSWEQFQTLADREYDNGYGGAEVLTDIVIVFVDGTKLSRREYGGFEWWNVQKPFVMPEETKEIDSLFVENYNYRFQDLKEEEGSSDYWNDIASDGEADSDALASAGFGSNEDYGFFGDE